MSTSLKFLIVSSLALTLLLIQTGYSREKDDFDRFDGTGPSGVKIDVIEWGDNLELHIYPKGRVASIAMKKDTKNKNKPVMIIGYRFNHNPEHQYVRRNILGIPIGTRFNVYVDRTLDEYDKFIISNHKLAGKLEVVSLDKLEDHYPEGHPKSRRLAKKNQEKDKKRVPASGHAQQQGGHPHHQQNYHNQRAVPATPPAPKKNVDDNGSIKSFSW